MARLPKPISDVLKGKTEPQMRFGAWLWRHRARAGAGGGAPRVFFAVPLVSRRRSGDWQVVCANLARTIAAFRSQTVPDWEAVICGQDRPEGVTFDAQVRFLPFSGGDKFYDKGDKRIALIRHIASGADAAGYYMQFDADDILHPGAVAYMLEQDNGRGYVIDRGYMADLDAGLFARLAPPSAAHPGTRPFNHYCGSSNAVRVDFRPGARGSDRLLKKLKAHGRIEGQMRLHGLPMDPLPFPAALYLVNHGENMVERRGNLGGKLDYMERQRISDPAEIAEITRTFGLGALPDPASA